VTSLRIKRLLFPIIILYALIPRTTNYSQYSGPYLYDAVEDISYFIAFDSTYISLIETDHLAAVDFLFDRTLNYYGGDISEALLALTFTTVPFDTMPFRIPLIGLGLDAPLPSGGTDYFEKKRENLPSRILFDSPETKFGDKDKLAHFFGSAFIAYNIRFFNLSEFIGIFIELFEESFKVDGAISERDLIVNKLGILFGNEIVNDSDARPSDYLNLYTLLYINLAK
jgi:hypothetical protein